MTDAPFLDCYPMVETPPEIVPGRPRRAWMDATHQRYAYRCLPLTMANSTGWEVLCPFKLHIDWDGGDGKDAITLSSPFRHANLAALATSHFQHGIVTFHVGHMFRTPPGWGVWAMGPPNSPKDGIAPLAGLVETDWLPFPFTMNWQMTRPGRVTFAKGEPFCFVTLQQHTLLEAVQPERRALADNPQLAADYAAWQTSRADFIERLEARDPGAVEAGWQRNYMRGVKPTGQAAPDTHATKRRLRPLR